MGYVGCNIRCHTLKNKHFLHNTQEKSGGESGIRTHGTVTRTFDFESSALDQLSHLSAKKSDANYTLDSDM